MSWRAIRPLCKTSHLMEVRLFGLVHSCVAHYAFHDQDRFFRSALFPVDQRPGVIVSKSNLYIGRP